MLLDTLYKRPNFRSTSGKGLLRDCEKFADSSFAALHIPESRTRQPSSLSTAPGGRVVKTINLDTRILLSTPETICPKCSDDLQSTIKNCFQAIIYNANDNKGHQRLHNLLICKDL